MVLEGVQTDGRMSHATSMPTFQFLILLIQEKKKVFLKLTSNDMSQ